MDHGNRCKHLQVQACWAQLQQKRETSRITQYYMILYDIIFITFNYMSLLTEPWRMPGVSCQLGWTCEPRVVLSTAAQWAKQLQRGLHRQVVPAGGAAQDLGNQHESTILYQFISHQWYNTYQYIFFCFCSTAHTHIYYLILVLYYIVIVMLCYVMICCVMLCYTILYYVYPHAFLSRTLSLSLSVSVSLSLSLSASLGSSWSDTLPRRRPKSCNGWHLPWRPWRLRHCRGWDPIARSWQVFQPVGRVYWVISLKQMRVQEGTIRFGDIPTALFCLRLS